MKTPLALLVLLALAAPALAYGTLEPVNELGTTLRVAAADPAARSVDDALAALGLPPSSRRVDYGEENATWSFYNDNNRNGRRDEGDTNLTLDPPGQRIETPHVHLRHARADGNATDHLEVNLTQEGTRLRVCPGDAEVGLTDGMARGLRCNGDVDRDGESDLDEASRHENPARPRDDDLPLLP